MLPTNIADWSDADWEMHELMTAANSDAPKCDQCEVRTHDLLPSIERPGDTICLGCAKREDMGR